MLKKCLTCSQAAILLPLLPCRMPHTNFSSFPLALWEKLFETLWRRNLTIKSFKINFYSKNKSIWDDFQLKSNNYKLGEEDKRRQCGQKQKVGRIWKFRIDLSCNECSLSLHECVTYREDDLFTQHGEGRVLCIFQLILKNREAHSHYIFTALSPDMDTWPGNLGSGSLPDSIQASDDPGEPFLSFPGLSSSWKDGIPSILIYQGKH